MWAMMEKFRILSLTFTYCKRRMPCRESHAAWWFGLVSGALVVEGFPMQHLQTLQKPGLQIPNPNQGVPDNLQARATVAIPANPQKVWLQENLQEMAVKSCFSVELPVTQPFECKIFVSGALIWTQRSLPFMAKSCTCCHTKLLPRTTPEFLFKETCNKGQRDTRETTICRRQV